MAHFEIEDDDQDVDYNFSSNWKQPKKSTATYFGGGGAGDDGDGYNFSFDQPKSKSKRNTQFSPDSSTSSYGATKPSSKPAAKTETKPSTTGKPASALDLASSVLAKYSSKPAATSVSQPFGRKPYANEFDEDAISVGSDEVEEFDLSESMGRNSNPSGKGKSNASSAPPRKESLNVKQPPIRSAFEMSNSFEQSYEDTNKKTVVSKKDLPSLMMPDDDETNVPVVSAIPAPAPVKTAAGKGVLALKLPVDEDSMYQGDEVSDEDEDASGVEESIAMDESLASSGEDYVKKGSVAVGYSIKSGPAAPVAAPAPPPAPAPVAAVSTTATTNPNMDYSVEFEDDFEEDLNDRYGVDMSQIQHDRSDGEEDDYEDDTHHEEVSQSSDNKPSAPKIMNFSDLNDIMIADAAVDAGAVSDRPTSRSASVSPPPPAAVLERGPISSTSSLYRAPINSISSTGSQVAVAPTRASSADPRPARLAGSPTDDIVHFTKDSKVFEPPRTTAMPAMSRSTESDEEVVNVPYPARQTPSSAASSSSAALAVTQAVPTASKPSVSTKEPVQASANTHVGHRPIVEDKDSPVQVPSLLYTSVEPTQIQRAPMSAPISSQPHQPAVAAQDFVRYQPPAVSQKQYEQHSQPPFQAAQPPLQQQQQQVPPMPAYVPQGYVPLGAIQQQAIQQALPQVPGGMIPAAPLPAPPPPHSLYSPYPPNPYMPPYPYPSPYMSMPNPYPYAGSPYAAGGAFPNPMAMSTPYFNNPFNPYMSQPGMPPLAASGASNLMAQSLPGLPSASMASVSDPLLKELLTELRQAKEDAAWAKNKLAEMIVLMHNKSEAADDARSSRTSPSSSPSRQRQHSKSGASRKANPPRYGNNDDDNGNDAYSNDEFEDYSNDFDNESPSPIQRPGKSGSSKLHPQASTKSRSSQKDKRASSRLPSQGPVPSSRMEDGDINPSSAGVNANYPNRTVLGSYDPIPGPATNYQQPRTVPGIGGDIDITSSLLTSQALFRRQLQSLRDRLNMTTAVTSPQYRTQLTDAYDHSLEQRLRASTGGMSGSLHRDVQSSGVGFGNGGRTEPVGNPDAPQLSNNNDASQNPNRLKLWEVIMQTQPQLDELSAKELAIRYAAALT